MRVTSFLVRIEGNVAESKILFLIQYYLLYTLLGNLSAIFSYFHTYFPFIFSVTHILSVRYPLARADVAYIRIVMVIYGYSPSTHFRVYIYIYTYLSI